MEKDMPLFGVFKPNVNAETDHIIFFFNFEEKVL